MADRIAPTPRSNKLLGLLADALDGAYDYTQRPDPTMPMGLANPVLGLLGNALPLKAGANVLDDLSYGRAPIRGTGMTTRLTPDATELAMAAAPFPKTSGKAALAALGAVDTGVGKAMFIGPTAKTWDKAAAATAQKLEKAGADPRAIWSETGTFKGPDGKWRQEISDDKARMIGLDGTDKQASMVNLLSHKPLYDAYPAKQYYQAEVTSATTLPPHLRKRLVGKGDGSFTPAGPDGEPLIKTTAYTPEDTSTTLHELQHAIQQREGFARGGNVNEFAGGPMFDVKARELAADLSRSLTGGISAKPEEIIGSLRYGDPKDLGNIAAKHGFGSIDDAVSFLKLEDSKRTPFGQYRRLAGEAEARATQARMNMTPEQRRATFPYDSYDVPVNQLIVRSLLD